LTKKEAFIEISNQDIYDRIERYHDDNSSEHQAIISRLDITNGKVKLSKWIATTALAVTMSVLVFLLSHMAK